MSSYKPSIFNDVLGPIMTGPSSSHTAAPGRIGLFISKLMDDFNNIQIFFPDESSYMKVYKGQKSDIAFLAGLMGMNIDDPEFGNSLDIAKNKGINFSVLSYEGDFGHPNTCFILLSNSAGKKLSVESLSTGGGMFTIRKINNCPVDCRGDSHELIFFHKLSESNLADNKISDFFKKNDDICIQNNFQTVDGVLNVTLLEKPSVKLLKALSMLVLEYDGEVRYIEPILPVVSLNNKSLPFDTAEQMKKYLHRHPMQLWEAGVKYESARSGWSEERVLAYAEHLIFIMRESVNQGLNSELATKSFLKPTANLMRKTSNEKILIPTGVIEKAIIYSTAVMEYNAAMGIIVAGPTAGSCGVLPGTLFGITGLETTEVTNAAKALLSAGIIGVFIANQATFAAEVCGCQAETGAASCMAAALASYYLESDAETALSACSMALQNMLGLICDPVAGCVDIPCVNRNAMAVANAIVSANMVSCGFDPIIPLDQTIETMFRVGKMLPRELRCTGEGGLCLTAKAQEIEKELSSKM